MKRTLEADDLVLVRPTHLSPVPARQLDRRLDAFGTRVAEENLIELRHPGESFGQLDRRFGPVQVRDVADLRRLARERGRRILVPVPEGDDGESGDEVEILISLVIPDPTPLAADEGERTRRIRRQHAAITPLGETHATTSVPAPIRTCRTPPERAAAQASSLGSIPPDAAAGGDDARIRSMTTPASS